MEPGDLDALYAATYRRLVVQLYAICGDLTDAEDAVQEAFVAAVRKQRELARVGNVEAWLRTVAVNRLRHGWRHAKVVTKYQGKVPGPQAPVEVGPEHVAIVRALSELDRDLRRVVVLTVSCGSGHPRHIVSRHRRHDVSGHRRQRRSATDGSAMSKARLVITALTVEQQTVAEVAARYGVHRSWVYGLKARYDDVGEAAFEPRSRRPHTSPTATPAAPSSWSCGYARSSPRPAWTPAQTPSPGT